MLGEDDLDDLAWEAPFLARVTGAVLSGDYPVYTIAEQDADPETGLPQDAQPGRAGPARERNNQVVKVGTYVQAQFRTVFDGEPLYEFDCGCPCDCCCPVTEGFEVTGDKLVYVKAGEYEAADFAAAAPGDVLAVQADGTLAFAAPAAPAGVALTSGTLAQFAATTSAQLRGVLSDETGTGPAYFQGGDLGTPSAGVLTNASGLPATGVGRLDALTDAEPALADRVPFFDASAVANRDCGWDHVGGLVALTVSELRLTLTTAVPVTTADVTAAGTLYLTPHVGNRIRLYSTAWKVLHTAEVSLALTLTSGKNYDVFAYDNSGTVTLELSAAWTNDTTRADALTTQDGVTVKSGATSRLWLGTIRASGTNTTEDSATKRFVWNTFNRRRRHLLKTLSTDSWTYASATYRQANADTTAKVEAVFGAAEDVALAEVRCEGQCATGPNVGGVGVGVDVTNANSAQLFNELMNSGLTAVTFALYRGHPGVGYHYFAWVEAARAGTATFYGDGGIPSNVQSGVAGEVWG